MYKHYLYLKYVLRHKWFVFISCWQLGIPWLGLIHDISKFSPSEWIPYVYYFYGDPGGDGIKTGRDETGYYKPGETGDLAFDMAWVYHQKRNKHHWQYWVIPQDGGGVKVMEMPPRYKREMVADWRGAGLAQGTPDICKWYHAHKRDIQLHPKTRLWVEMEIGYR